MIASNERLGGRRPLFSSMPSDDPLHAYYTNAERVTRETWNLADHLMFKYADGQLHPTDTRFGTMASTAFDARPHRTICQQVWHVDAAARVRLLRRHRARVCVGD